MMAVADKSVLVIELIYPRYISIINHFYIFDVYIWKTEQNKTKPHVKQRQKVFFKVIKRVTY